MFCLIWQAKVPSLSRSRSRSHEVMQLVVLVTFLSTVLAAPSSLDLVRAKRKVPRGHLQGSTPQAIRDKLNLALSTGEVSMPNAVPCEDFNLEELDALQSLMTLHHEPDLMTSDLRRLHVTSVEALTSQHTEERSYLHAHPEVRDALQAAKCADVAMAWVHHLSQDSRRVLAKHRLPLLPVRGTQDFGPDLLKQGHHSVLRKILGANTCQTGHAATPVARGSWTGFPSWPDEVEYNATGFGPYPFWAGGPPSNSDSSENSTTPAQGAPIHTYWSGVLNAEKLEHNGVCSIKALGAEADGPCTHLMLGTQYAYLYSQDESFCCMSSKPSYKCHLTPMQRDFYKAFTDEGTVENYVSESGYYNGTIKRYSMTIGGNFYFWYATDLSGKPVEQGEGPCNMWKSDSSRSRSCGGPPKMLWHQYNRDTFKSTKLDPEVFALPSICKSTTKTCLVTPTFFCSGAETLVI